MPDNTPVASGSPLNSCSQCGEIYDFKFNEKCPKCGFDNVGSNIAETVFDGQTLTPEQKYKLLDKNLTDEERRFLWKKLVKLPTPSTAAYYKQKWALQLMPDINSMMEDEKHRPLLYPFDDFPSWSELTLYTYINQGFKYICDAMDPTGIYKEFRQKVEIKMWTKEGKKTRGVYIVSIGHFSTHILKAKVITNLDELPEFKMGLGRPETNGEAGDYMKQISDFMEHAVESGQKLELKDTTLSPDQVRDLKEFFETSLGSSDPNEKPTFVGAVGEGGKMIMIRRL